jgi:arylsulfatase A-like enzyme
MPYILILLSMLLFSCEGEAIEVERHKPAPISTAPVSKVKNVILITVDTLRADFLGAYGGMAHTPNFDKLAATGWQFEQCYSASMLTNPSHASIMTSLYPRDHSVYDNESGIGNGVGTLASSLSRRGWNTMAVIGFPHLNPEVSNLGQGFAHIQRATRKELNAAETTESALNLLDSERKDRPFFMWVHYVDPHAPYEPGSHKNVREVYDHRTPMIKAKRAAPGFQKNNPWFKKAFRKYKYTEELVNRYVAEIEETDAGIGELLRGLASRNLGDDTAIVLTSDHGENLGERDLYFHHGGLYKETTHVPLIIAAPNAKPVRYTGLVETVDIAPTILELLDAPRWEPMRGESLIAKIRGQEPARTHVYSEHMHRQLVSVRDVEQALILHRSSSRQFPNYRFESGKIELLDRTGESASAEQIKDAHQQDIYKALQEYMGAGLRFVARSAIRQDRESLRALGYIE